MEAWHVDNDTDALGDSLDGSLCIGGCDVNAHRESAHRVRQPPARLAGAFYARPTAALSQHELGSDNQGEMSPSHSSINRRHTTLSQ